MIRPRFGVRLQLLGFTFGLVLLVCGALIWFHFEQQRSAELDRLKDKAESLTNTLARNLLNPVYLLDVRQVRLLLATGLADPGVQQLTAIDAGGRVLASANANERLRNTAFRDPELLARAAQSARPVSRVEGDTLQMAVPLRLADDRVIGYLHMAMSLVSARERSAVVARQTALLSIGLLAVAALLAYLLARRISQPLERLAAAAGEVRSGRFDVNVPSARDDEIGAVAREFNAMVRSLRAQTDELVLAREAAEQASLAKTQFLSNMSHEMRTPLNGVIGVLDLLALEPGDNPRRRQLLDAGRESGAVLLNLVNDILDLSRIEAGQLQLVDSECELLTLLDSMVDPQAEEARAKGLDLALHLEPGLPKTVVTDPVRLRQAVVNLVRNAVKFTERGHVILHVSLNDVADRSPEGERLLKLEVHDTGIGIALEAQSRIFESFVQADGSITRRYGGSGLGLAIAHRLVTAMGGSIALRSEVAVGSVFTVTVPVRVRIESSPATLAQSAAVVLHANPALAAALVSLLRSAGSEAWAADPAAPALDGATAVILDEALLHTPAAARVREKLATVQRVHLLRLVSAGQSPSALSPVNWQGSAVVLDKPITRTALLGAMLAARPAAPSPAREAAPLNVLLVDDNAVNRVVAGATLEELGYAVDVATDGETALRLLGEKRFDMVLLDCQMPVMDGFAAAREIRRRERTGELPAPRRTILALTAHSADTHRDECLAAGMDGFIAKPFSRPQLQRELERWRPAVAAAR